MLQKLATTTLVLALPLLVPDTAAANSAVTSESVRHQGHGTTRATDRGLVGLDVSAGHEQTFVPFRGEFLDSRERSLTSYYEKARTKERKRVAKKHHTKRSKKRHASKPVQENDSFDALSCLDGFGGKAHAKSEKKKAPLTATVSTGTRRRVSRDLRVPVTPGL